jgi:hypothetical protein
MSQKLIAVWMIVIGMAILLARWAIPAHAQKATPENDANCVACHEHQYYVYDNGKWFCLCDAPMHCVYCHGGRTDTTVVEKQAHEGLVLYPTRDHAARCQTCHTEDYMSRVVTFEMAAGVSSTPLAIITATPIEPTAALIEESQASPLMLRLNQLGPWRLTGLGVLGIAMIGILIFGFRCWKADCLARLKIGKSV